MSVSVATGDRLIRFHRVLASRITAWGCAPSPNALSLFLQLEVKCAGHGSPSCRRHRHPVPGASRHRPNGQHHPTVVASRLAMRRSAPPSPKLHSPSLANALPCRLATASPDGNRQHHAPGPLFEPALSHPIRTSMALMVVRTGFAKATAIAESPIPAEADRPATISRHLDYLGGLERLRMSAMLPHLAIQEGASIRCGVRPDAISCSPRRATHYMM